MDKKEYPFQLFIELIFENEAEAKMVTTIIMPEVKSNPFTRSLLKIQQQNEKITCKIYARDKNALLASQNMLHRWIQIINELLNVSKEAHP